MVNDKTKIVKDDFTCDVDLKEYTDSLLFDEDEEIASYAATDKYGNMANLRLTVAGEKKITRLAEPDADRDDDDDDYDDYDKDFYDVSDYDEELIADIKSGEVYNEDKYEIVYNNWFDIVYELISAENDDVVYADDEVCETDFSKMTKDELKDFLKECAEGYLDWGYERKLLKEPKDKARGERE